MFVVSITLIHIDVDWSWGLCHAIVFVVSIALIRIGVNWIEGLRQVIVFPVSLALIRIDVDSPRRWWLIKISILECAKGLNLIVLG